MAVSFPSNVNGITEVGVAAGSDVFSEAPYQVTVRYRALATAPREPTISEVRANNAAQEWAALNDAAAREAFYGNDARLIGPSGATAAEVRAHIVNWPADVATARNQAALNVGNVSTVVTDYDTWIAVPASRRDHLEVDLTSSLRSTDLPGSNAVAQKLYQSLVHALLARGWFIRDSVAAHGLLIHQGPEVAVAHTRSVAEINALGFRDAQESLNLMVALKITWYLMNHHVGQVEDQIQGFVGKLCAIYDLVSDSNTPQNREVRKVLWAIGKMLTTRGLLNAIGVPNINYGDHTNTPSPEGNDYAYANPIAITASEDIRKRIESYPAGTAALGTYFAIVKRAKSSVFSIVVPPMVNIGWDSAGGDWTGQVKTHSDAVLADPAAYHMGAVFLTGNPRLTADPWSEEEKHNLSAFIHAVAPDSTLAKAPVIVKKSEITGNIVYNAIQSIKAKIASTTGDRMTTLLLSRMGAGGGTGGLAAQVGTVSTNEVTAATRALEDYDAGGVEDDEEPGRRETADQRQAREARNAARAARRAALGNAIAVLGPLPANEDE